DVGHALAATLLADRGAGTALGAAAGAIGARFMPPEGDRTAATTVSLSKVDLDGHAEVAAGLRPTPSAAAEQIAEEIAEGLEDRILVEIGHRHAGKAGVPIAIVKIALLRIA